MGKEIMLPRRGMVMVMRIRGRRGDGTNGMGKGA
jgi:hypothetical protein